MANRAYKGRRFEIALAAKLSLWWSGGDRDDVFYHSHGSGGRATARAKAGKKTAGHYGDVSAADPCGKPFTDLFIVEAKNGYNRATLQDLLDKPAGAAAQQYETWFAKAAADAAAAGSVGWLLVHKRDKREPLAFLPAGNKELDGLIGGASAAYGNLYVATEKDGRAVDAYPLDVLLALLHPGDVKEAMAEKKAKDSA